MTQASLITGFTPSVTPPVDFPSPFEMQPHALARQACELLMARLPQLTTTHQFHRSGGGKMLGALVVKTTDNQFAYLSAFSGMLGSEWSVPGFVPPVFDIEQRRCFLPAGEARLKTMASRLRALKNSADLQQAVNEKKRLQAEACQHLQQLKQEHLRRREARANQRQQLHAGTADSLTESLASLAAQSSGDKRRYRELSVHWRNRIATAEQSIGQFQQQIDALAKQRASLSRSLQQAVFAGYNLCNASAGHAAIERFFTDKMPPSGTGDCVAIKLLQYCYQCQLEPVCLGEFWWGAEPSGGIRHHRQYYPACRGKCGPILPFMLRGLTVTVPRHEQPAAFTDNEPVVVFEDSSIVVVDKPAGMLSVPGKRLSDSVESRLRQRYPDTQSDMLVHRLDQATSGLLVAARSAALRSRLQQQFQRREVTKKYLAVVTGRVNPLQGIIELPLRVDIDDRPRQCVCAQHGKAAVTRYRVVDSNQDTTRIELYPQTGRTHQLRVHTAHAQGLNAAIVGDELYGRAASRLCLHAASISFDHPLSGERVTFTSAVPF